MRYLSIVAFLAMVIFFTLWSMYEDRKKQVLAEDFSTEMLRWVVEEESDSSQVLFHGDTLEVIASERFTAWFDHKLPGKYQITFSFSFQPAGSETSPWSLNFMWAASAPGKAGLPSYLDLGFYPLDTRLSVWTADHPNEFSGVCFDEIISGERAKWYDVKIIAGENEVNVIWDEKKEAIEKTIPSEGYFGFSAVNGSFLITGLEIRMLKS